jgi:hypothetical protein
MSIKLSDTQLLMLSAAAQRADRSLTLPEKLKGVAAQKVAMKLIAAGLVKEVKAKAGMPVWRRDDQDGQSYALKLTAAGAQAIAVNSDDAAHANDEERSREEQDQSPTFAQSPCTAAAASAAPGSRALETPRAPRIGTKLARAISAGSEDGVNAPPNSLGVGTTTTTRAPDPVDANQDAEQLKACASPIAPRSGTKIDDVINMLSRPEGATIDGLVEAMGWLPHTTRAALTRLRKRGYAIGRSRTREGGSSVYRLTWPSQPGV